MSIFKIQIKAGTPAVYDPSTQTAFVNDSVFWFNSDKVAHWPTPDPKKPKAWLDFQIAPNGQSAQISLDPLNPPGNYTLNYVCSLHPGEKGQIKVIGKAKKGAFGGKTKKGAFAKGTKRGALGKLTLKGTLAKPAKKGAFAKPAKKGPFAKVAKKGPFGKTTKK